MLIKFLLVFIGCVFVYVILFFKVCNGKYRLIELFFFFMIVYEICLKIVLKLFKLLMLKGLNKVWKFIDE